MKFNRFVLWKMFAKREFSNHMIEYCLFRLLNHRWMQLLMLLVGVIPYIKCGILQVQFFYKLVCVLFLIVPCILLMMLKSRSVRLPMVQLVKIMGLYSSCDSQRVYLFCNLVRVKATVVVVYSIIPMVAGMSVVLLAMLLDVDDKRFQPCLRRRPLILVGFEQ